ncbi:glycosyltransferase [Pseudodesulfovibrio sp. zrk46]|uniref:glycosyltransferase family protein n=1 Tax=Pseudodesulfovibrio sp. zrk46 TaxID=2725288 RepID=UPI001448F778|nr:glycosyltransferase [Pseudodesulfovibrio sp. zrk46]QJB58262.1 glycosyltransferase [Pseudodesulfovibrio sp. zrk46]
MPRPVRTRITNELGNLQTLPEDKGQFEIIPGNKDVVFLGLGPQPELLRDYFPEHSSASYVESGSMLDQIENWEDKVPQGFTQITSDEFTPERAATSTVVRYRPGLKAFPSFWGPLTARTAASRLPEKATTPIIWLPFGEEDLLGRELTIAFQARGYAVRHLDRETLERSAGTELPALLAEEKPALFFSINFKGLEPFGLGFNILREAGVKVAVWLVDNPFNILTSVKSAYWKEAHLFVTDHSFIGPLIQTGARWVTHLPLAACPELFGEGGTLPKHGDDLEDKLVFVGRSEFPKKNEFFAGLTPNHLLLEEAIGMLEKGDRPHFHWWQEHILANLWPGNQVRHVGIGAEVAGYAWRTRCLSAMNKHTVIFGDDQWSHIDSIKAEVRSLLDYYTHLPAVYREASVSLNVTGMQLPAGLTQRHFDVWCAGGFLLTDNNPGLKIFPENLAEAIIFSTPKEIESLFMRYRDESVAKTELRAAWRDHILKEHTYHNRVQTIFQTMDLPLSWITP